jgi:hypothetical protein
MLFTRPGFLTREYVQGRRVSYLPPVRLYLVASVLFFLSLSLETLIPSIQNSKFLQELAETGDLDDALVNTVDSLKAAVLSETALDSGFSQVDTASVISSSSAAVVEIGGNEFNFQQQDFRSTFSDNFAKVMFLLLPVAALQLKALYWRRQKRYIEHLIFSLHVHAFIFSLLILTVILDYKFVMWGVIIGSLSYLYLALKRYYEQSHPKTAAKMLLLLFSYGMTLMLVMTFTMIVTAVGLVLGS